MKPKDTHFIFKFKTKEEANEKINNGIKEGLDLYCCVYIEYDDLYHVVLTTEKKTIQEKYDQLLKAYNSVYNDYRNLMKKYNEPVFDIWNLG